MKKFLKLFFLFLISISLFGCQNNSSNNSIPNTNASNNVEIDEYEVTSLTIINNPNKMTYDIGEVFDYTGVRLKAIWNDGEEEEFGGYRCDSIEPSTPLTVNDTKVTFTYWNATVNLDININKSEVSSISVDTSKLLCRVNIGKYIDLSSIIVNAFYGEESKQVTSYQIYEGDKLIENINRYLVNKGDHVLTVKYLDKSANFIVTGYDGTFIEFDSSSIKTDAETSENLIYYVEPANIVNSYKSGSKGWESCTKSSFRVATNAGITDIKALAKIKIHVYSNINTYAKMSVNAGGYNITRPDIGLTSDMYLSKVCNVKVNDIAVNVKEGLLPANNKNGEMLSDKWTPYFVNVDFIEAWLKKGDNLIEIDVNENYYKLEPFSNQRYGEVYFALKNMSIEYVEGQKSVTNLELVTKPNKTVYKVGEIFDPTGMVIKAHYDDYSSEIITDYYYDKTPLTANSKQVVITYLNKNINIDIKVEHNHLYSENYINNENYHWHECSLCGDKKDYGEHNLTKIVMVKEPNLIDYDENESLSLEGIKVNAICSICGNVDISDKVNTNITTLTLSNNELKQEYKKIIISYKEFTTSYQITIHKAYNVLGKNRQDPKSTNEKYYVEKSITMENGKYEFQGSDVISNVEVGAKIKFHFYSEINGKANFSLLAGSLYCDGNKNEKGFYLNTNDMIAKNFMQLNVKNNNDFINQNFIENAYIKGHKLPSNYEELGITSTVWCMNQFSKSVLANIDVVKGDNIIELVILDARNIGYKNAWGGAATLNIKQATLSFIED